ncbi:MAG: crotonobetainyl-CoA:carnitine CoA-transferase CaiB-like acyl-CoA transferase [Candidatus Azotimanducaceae bacterium]|jgi:crotonobetainyl-CoA:carnitine CoA-transferase CaiB-like acyl-CoA transferase
MSTLLFEGLKVLDVGSWIAAPSCATILADLGADVIKIEAPEVGDVYRTYYQMPPSPDAEVNYTWILDNHSKRSLTLNLKNEAGREVLLRLMRDCDVYITNQPLPMRRSLQLMPEDLMPQNPRMIYASLTAYGEKGPDADRESFDLVAYWSRSGLMNQMRHKGVEPIQAMAGMGDHPTGMSLYANIVTALLKRERTGEGSLVHTSLLANGIWSASCFAQSSWAAGDFSPIPGQRVTTALYEASDERWLQFSMIRTEEMFDRLLLALDKAEWLVDERFTSMESRLTHAAELTQLFREVIAQRSSSEWMVVFQANDVPAALVAEFHDLPLDEQVLANDMAMPPAVDLGMERVIRAPINVSGVAHRPAEPAPEMGEHNDAILAEMGYSAQEIANFKREGIV